MNLKDRNIMITGSAQGIGRAMAVALAARGARPVLVDLNADKLAESAELCARAGSKAHVFTANIAVEEEVTALFGTVLQQCGPLHGLINNAGITRDALLVKIKDGQLVDRMSLEQWQMVIDINLTGVFLCGREAATQMINSQTQGVIVNISSISRAGNIGQSNYSAAKAGVAALTTTWARELARYGIRCVAIAPGVVATDMTAGMKPEALEKLVAGVPLKRLGTAEEIASTAVFLLENDYMSGRVLEVDGCLRL